MPRWVQASGISHAHQHVRRDGTKHHTHMLTRYTLPPSLSTRSLTASTGNGIGRHLPLQEDAALRLWAFHWFGASASAFGPWEWHMTDDVELCAVQVSRRTPSRDSDPTERDLHRRDWCWMWRRSPSILHAFNKAALWWQLPLRSGLSACQAALPTPPCPAPIQPCRRASHYHARFHLSDALVAMLQIPEGTSTDRGCVDSQRSLCL